MISEKKILKQILDELISNDRYELTWSWDHPQLKIVINSDFVFADIANEVHKTDE